MANSSKCGEVHLSPRARLQSEVSVSSNSGLIWSRREFMTMLGRAGMLLSFTSGYYPLSRPRSANQVVFTDVTASARLLHATNICGSRDNKQFLLEEMGCGVALFDYDNDGWLDIFLVNGTSLDPAISHLHPTSYLFRNNRDGTFTDVTARSGLSHSGWGQGCCVGDYDNDGFEDLFVTYWGHNVLYHNNGDGTFTDASARAGVEGTEWRWGAGCCFLDYDRDGHLDLFVANYLNFDLETAPKRGDSVYCRYNEIGVPCGPLGFAGGTNILYRNRGDGTFEDVSEQSGIVNPRGPSVMVFVGTNWRPRGSYGMGAAAADFDNDGWPDIYVACDSAPSLLYRNNHDGTFREIAVPAGCGLDENGVALSGMGVAVADYDGDGWLDIARTNFSEQVTTLYRNYGNGAFEDASIKAGLGVNRKYLGFGVGFVDFNNDGWKDLFLANGHVYSQIANRKLHISYKEPKVVYRNLGNGRFQDVSFEAGKAIRAENLARGCAFGDFDNDGDVDVVINNLNRNNWMIVKCVGTRSNRSAIGTRVRVTSGGRSQIDEVMSGSSYYSQNDLRLHFGLGKANKVDDLEIAWPSGRKETFKHLPVNQFLVVEETRGIVDSRKPR
ncbi:MAG: RNA-binding protein [Acidobacteria bacterium]|nr:MAG: RNA-binding protein [Acidobacteriota bacterium]